jgi:hypothetical protein
MRIEVWSECDCATKTGELMNICCYMQSPTRKHWTRTHTQHTHSAHTHIHHAQHTRTHTHTQHWPVALLNVGNVVTRPNRKSNRAIQLHGCTAVAHEKFQHNWGLNVGSRTSRLRACVAGSAVRGRGAPRRCEARSPLVGLRLGSAEVQLLASDPSGRSQAKQRKAAEPLPLVGAGRSSASALRSARSRRSSSCLETTAEAPSPCSPFNDACCVASCCRT